MTIIIIAAAVVAAGAYLRWAVIPVAYAFRLGRRLERIRHRCGRR
jgi:hypothetical protein